jgi:uncharacterized protein (DUF111 family)
MMKKSAKLLLLQIDHLSGEEVGYLIDSLYAWRAQNVQVISTLTKKNRPGCIVLVDMGSEKETRLMEALAREFGIAGGHRIDTTHCHHPVSSIHRKIRVRKDGREVQTAIRCKRIGPRKKPLHFRLEHEDLSRLKECLQRELGVAIPLSTLRRDIEALLKTPGILVLEI